MYKEHSVLPVSPFKMISFGFVSISPSSVFPKQVFRMLFLLVYYTVHVLRFAPPDRMCIWLFLLMVVDGALVLD